MKVQVQFKESYNYPLLIFPVLKKQGLVQVAACANFMFWLQHDALFLSTTLTLVKTASGINVFLKCCLEVHNCCGLDLFVCLFLNNLFCKV